MDLENYFSKAFNNKCNLTNHAIKRINERFLFSELEKLKLLVQAGIRYKSLNKWKENQEIAIVDARFNFSIFCVYSQNIVKIITFVRGEKKYNNCDLISVSILKEKADQEVMILNNKIKKDYKY